MSENKYNQEEVKKIIKLATELQNSDLETDLQTEKGISMQELEQIGDEVGLNNKYLRAAALEFQDENTVTHSSSNKTHNFEERDLAMEMEPHLWDELTSVLRHHLGTQYGEINEDPAHMEWTHLSLSGVQTKMTISSRENHTRLRLSQQIGLASPKTEAAMYGGGLGTLLCIITGSVMPTPTIYLYLLILLSSILAVYGLDKAWRKKKKQNLNQLADQLVNRLRKSSKSNPELSEKDDKINQQSEIEIENDLQEQPNSSEDKQGRNRVKS